MDYIHESKIFNDRANSIMRYWFLVLFSGALGTKIRVEGHEKCPIVWHLVCASVINNVIKLLAKLHKNLENCLFAGFCVELRVGAKRRSVEETRVSRPVYMECTPMSLLSRTGSEVSSRSNLIQIDWTSNHMILKKWTKWNIGQSFIKIYIRWSFGDHYMFIKWSLGWSLDDR